MKPVLLSCLALLMALLMACATPRYGARIEMFGEQTLASTNLNRRVDKVPNHQARRIRVFMGQLPPGFAIKNKQLAVTPPYTHRILGKVATTGLRGYNKDRRGYCHISSGAAMIICISLGLSILPLVGFLACPCIYNNQSNSIESIEVRKAALIVALQRATLAAGGNALIIESLGKTVAINTNTNQVLSVKEMTAASGYAVQISQQRRLPRPVVVPGGSSSH